MKNKTIKFRPHLAELILQGKKKSTWRLFDDKDLQVGDITDFINWETGETFAQALLVHITQRTLGTIQEIDWQGHERFASEQEMYSVYKAYYGERVDENSPVKIIGFKLIEL